MTATAAGLSRRADPTLRWSWSADLDTATLYGLLRLRGVVFVVEQGCLYSDLDGRDLAPGTRHFWIEEADSGIVSCLRLLDDGAGGYWIGRVCTASPARGHGYSARLVRAALDQIGTSRCRMNAQAHLTSMYGKLGFVVSGDEFLDVGIAHRPMERVS